MIESLRNSFAGGWNTDSDSRMVKPNQFTDAQDVEVFSDEQDTLSAIRPVKSMELKYTVPDVPSSPCVIRLEWKSGLTIGTRLFDANNNQIVYVSPSIYSSADDYITAINSAITGIGYEAFNSGTTVYDGTTFIRARFRNIPSTNANFRVVQYLEGVETDCPILQYGTYGGNLIEVASATVDSKAFILSSGSGFGEIGVYDGSTYTAVYRSNKTVFSTANTIDVRVEKTNNNKYAVYFTDNEMKPKVLYIKEDYSNLCTHKYTMTSYGEGTDGYIVLGVEDQQTNLQITSSSLFVSFKEQIQSGGFLTSGGYRYAVRAGVNGTEDVTPWSFLTPNVTPVFDTSTDAPNAFFTIQGTPGITTTKVNVLTVEGINKYVFNFIDVAAVYYAGQSATSASATVIGRFDITSNSMDINHIGNEIGTSLDTADLPEYDDIILKAESLEIKKNRLNLANVELAIDEDLSSQFASATIQTGMEPLTFSGSLTSAQDVVLTTVPDWNFNNEGGPVEGTTIFGPYTSFCLPVITNDTSFNQYGAYAVSGADRIYTWSPSMPAGVMKVDLSYRIKVSFTTATLVVYKSPFLDFNLEIWKSTGGGPFNRIWSNAQHADESNDDTVYKLTTNIEGGPGDQFKFMYQVRDWQVQAFNGFIEYYFGYDTGVTLTYLTETLTSLDTGEYLDPGNCSNKVGYMLNESYPFFARVHYKNGYISSPYYIGTHKFEFDRNTINSDKIFTTIPATAGDGGPPPISFLNSYAYYAKILNIPVASIRNTADYISIWRGECNPTVLGTGVIMAADKIYGSKTFGAGLFPSKFSGDTYGTTYPAENEQQRKYGMFLSPDTKLNKTKYSGGKIVTLGCPVVLSNQGTVYGKQYGNSSQFGSYAEYYGSSDYNESATLNIISGNYVEFASESRPLQRTDDSTDIAFNGDYNVAVTGSMSGVAVTLDGYLKKSSGGNSANDNGIYLAQYIVDVQNQYDIQNVRIVPTGAKVNLSEYPDVTSVNVNVFGGDTYTQKNYIKLCYWTKQSEMSAFMGAGITGIDENSVFSSFIGYYGQARYNSQLTYNNGVDYPTFTLQGKKTIYDYLFSFEKIDDVVEEQFNYDSGFSAPNILNRTLAYNTRTVQPSKLVSRIYYTDKKPISAVSDIYRRIKRSSYRDLDPKNGPIHGIIDQGDHMVALQPYSVTPLVYNTDAFVTTSMGAVQTTTGDVYPLNQTPVSAFGPSTKSAVLKGMNRNGNVTTYWVSDWSKKVLRYGYDGVAILSDQFNVRTYLLKRMSDTNTNNDIAMGYRPRNQQVYITFKDAEDPESRLTIGWNETGNIFTGKYSFAPTRYFTYNDYLLSSDNNGSVYSIGTGTDYMKWYGSPTVNGHFIIELAYNKLPEITKRAFAFALNVAEQKDSEPLLVFPTATISSKQYSSSTSNFEHRRGELVATSIADGNNDIMGQWIKVKIETDSYISLLSANLKVGYKRRLI